MAAASAREVSRGSAALAPFRRKTRKPGQRGDEGAFAGTAVAAELTKQIKVLRGEIDTESFYTSAVAAGVIDTLIPEFINAFAYDFNLAAEVKPGDTFEVAWEQSINAQGEPVGQPQLLFASLATPNKSMALSKYVHDKDDAVARAAIEGLAKLRPPL